MEHRLAVLPRFDSDACFAALLGSPEHGRWLIGFARSARIAEPTALAGVTLILASRFETNDGCATARRFHAAALKS
jgi:GH15 family glucan-1,4-alpha-glucosidase